MLWPDVLMHGWSLTRCTKTANKRYTNSWQNRQTNDWNNGIRCHWPESWLLDRCNSLGCITLSITLSANSITPSRPGSSLSVLICALKTSTKEARYDVSLWRDNLPPAKHANLLYRVQNGTSDCGLLAKLNTLRPWHWYLEGVKFMLAIADQLLTNLHTLRTWHWYIEKVDACQFFTQFLDVFNMTHTLCLYWFFTCMHYEQGSLLTHNGLHLYQGLEIGFRQ